MNRFYTITLRLALVGIAHLPSLSYAAPQKEMQLSSHAAPTKITYKITDGYGEYTGVGSTKIEASAQAREACISNKIDAYEAKTGETPDPDTADLFIDACINK